MKNWIKAFELSKKDQMGIWALCLLIVMVIGSSRVYQSFFASEYNSKTVDLDSLNEELKRLTNQSEIKLARFRFNINTISVDSLKLLGVSNSLASRIINYKKVIGQYKNISDLSRVYGMQESTLVVLDSLINWNLGDTLDVNISNDKLVGNSDRNTQLTVKKKAVLGDSININRKKEYNIELNNAESFELQLINGVGETLSKRIINYRDALGGFCSIKQIYEVYGLDSTKVDFGAINVSVTSTLIKKIKVNQVDVKSLSKHPYLDYYQSKLIVAYRKQHGNFKSLDELVQTKAFSKKELEKLAPYLDLDN